MALTIGVTGGIGSGKTTVCKVFKLLGAPVFEADEAAKQLLDNDRQVKSGLIHLFGDNIYTSNGTIDRKKLAGIIFDDKIQLSKMNELVHPAVRKNFENWVKQHEHCSYVIHEAAILFESGFYKIMDYTILVTAPENERIERVMKRDNVSRQKVKERIKNQFPEDKKQELANLVLTNDNKNLLIPKIIEIDKKLTEDGKIW
ncbi:MAG: dephospho-CoA kinase [Bacteroidota bacterium]